MTVEQQVKELIKKRYGTVKEFSEKINIPYTTMCSILRRGFANSGINNVMKVCNELNISPDALGAGKIERKNSNVISADDIILNIENNDILVENKKLNEEQKKRLIKYLKFLLSDI